MAQFVQVAESEEGNECPIELPCEDDQTMLLATLQSQFPGASGLKYKTETGTVRGVRLVDGRLQAPDAAWPASTIFYCVFPKENKRKSDDDQNEQNSTPKTKRVDAAGKNQASRCSDLIVLGLPWKTTEPELKEYFDQFGEVLMAQVKKDPRTGLSKGFGFVRFSDLEIQSRVIAKRHNIGGRWCETRIPLSRGEGSGHQNSEFNRKIFVGRLQEDVTTDDLRDYFSKFGEISDVFIPKPFRAFAFVTFNETEVAQSLCGEDHIVKGISVFVSNAVPKVDMSVSGYGHVSGGGGHGHSGYGTGPMSAAGMSGSQPGNMLNQGSSSRYGHHHQNNHHSYYDAYGPPPRRNQYQQHNPGGSYHHSSSQHNSPYSGSSPSSSQQQLWSGAHATQQARDSLSNLSSAVSTTGHQGNPMQSAYGLGGLNINSQAALQLAAAALAGQAGIQSIFGQGDAQGHPQNQGLGGWQTSGGPQGKDGNGHGDVGTLDCN